MRHLLGVLLAVAMGAALFFGGGWGIDRIMAMHARGATIAGEPGLIALGAVLGTGLLLGILMAAPGISPLGAGLPGLGLLAWSALLVLSARRAIQLIPLQGHSFATGFGSMLATGMLALAGIMMVIPLFVPSRWRREYGDEDDADYVDMPTAIGLVP
jgi:hypothetical protein